MADNLSGVSVFIPVYNEEDVLESSALTVHEYLRERGLIGEIVVVDNGSSDATISIGKQLAGEHSWFRFFSIDQRGAGRAFAYGVKEAKYNTIICLDADISSELVFLEYAIDLIKYSDMVVGSKTMGDQRRSPLRIFGSQLYILCTQLLLDLTLSDYSIGCKAYQKSEIIEVLDSVDPWTGYTLDLAVYLKNEVVELFRSASTVTIKERAVSISYMRVGTDFGTYFEFGKR